LRGRLLEARGPLLPELSLGGDFPESPLAALLLERADEGCDHRYLVLLRSVSLGSGEDDDLRLSFPGLKRGQARLAVNGERFLIAATRVVRTGRLLPLEAYVPLEPGKRLRLGPVEVAFSPAGDDDMKPGSPDGDLERGP
ncbi:hypothetical protein HY251_03100, partial [bacterium]|nr:hypothetical protein [bacterium]